LPDYAIPRTRTGIGAARKFAVVGRPVIGRLFRSGGA